MKIRIFSIFTAALLATGLAHALPPELAPPSGPPGPVMKTLDEVEPRAPISELPFTITESGSYYLTGNLTGVSGENGITIAAGVNNVTIDLMGFTLQGGEGSLDGIALSNKLSRSDNLTIRNGTITGFGGDGISIRHGVGRLVLNMHVSDNGGVGVRVFGAGAVIRSCTVSNNGGTGIWVIGGAVIESCTVIRNKSNGVFAESGVVIDRCTVSYNGGGISAGVGARVSQTSAHGNGEYGIAVSAGSNVIYCTVTETRGDGVRANGPGGVFGTPAAGQRIFISYSNSDNNEGAGIRVSRVGARIENNHVSQNKIGIYVESTGSIIVKNTAADNTEAGFRFVEGNEVGPVGI